MMDIWVVFLLIFLVALSPCSCLAEALLFLFVFCVWGDEQLSTSTVLTRPEPRAPGARAALAQVAILSSVSSLSLLPSVLALCLSQIGSAASGRRRADPPLVVPLSISARYVW